MDLTAARWDQIAGGRAAFDAAYARIALASAVKQNRWGAHLDSLGPPGQARWDPGLCEVELRGTVFHAEQIGSFDGETWLWSWANEHLALAEANTRRARSLRDTKRDIVAFATPMIQAADERLPYMMGALTLAYTDAEGYYIANQSQVYAILPGQVPQKRVAIGDVRLALDQLKSVAMPSDFATSLATAGRSFGFTVTEDDRAITVGDGKDQIVLDRASSHLHRLAVCFLPKRQTLADVVKLLADDRNVPTLAPDGSARGKGWEVKITVEDKLKPVMREAKALPRMIDEARKCATVVIVETASEPGFLDGVAPYMGAWAPTGMLRDPVGVVAMPAIHLVERLNRVPGALVYDTMLRSFYPTD